MISQSLYVSLPVTWYYSLTLLGPARFLLSFARSPQNLDVMKIEPFVSDSSELFVNTNLPDKLDNYLLCVMW